MEIIIYFILFQIYFYISKLHIFYICFWKFMDIWVFEFNIPPGLFNVKTN